MTNGNTERRKPDGASTSSPRPHQELALKPVFKGGRFDEANGYPAEALNEIAAYAKLIEAVAIRIHREREDRKEAKRGYAERIGLRLVRIEDGSSMPALYSEVDVVEDLQQAEDYVVEQLLRDDARVEPEIERYFRALGRSLGDGEFITLGTGRSRSVNYTSAKRKQILELSGQTDIDEIEVYGKVDSTATPEENEPWLMLKIVNGGPKVKMLMAHDAIRKALDRGVSDRLLLVRGTGEVQPNGTIHEITHVDLLRVVDGDLKGARETLVDQFERISSEVDQVALRRFRTFLEYCIAEGLDTRPYVVATDDGVEAEWQIDRSNTTATLLENLSVYVHITDLDKKTFREETVSLEYSGAMNLVELWRGGLDD